MEQEKSGHDAVVSIVKRNKNIVKLTPEMEIPLTKRIELLEILVQEAFAEFPPIKEAIKKLQQKIG